MIWLLSEASFIQADTLCEARALCNDLCSSQGSILGNETLAIHVKRRLKNAEKVHENGPKLTDVSSNPETGSWFKIPIQKNVILRATLKKDSAKEE